MAPADRTVLFSVRLPPEIARWLIARSTRLGRTNTAVITEALRELMDEG